MAVHLLSSADAVSRGLQLRHLRCLVVVAQERHLARAAARLSVSQPAVSKILTELEALAGEPLVERAASGRRGILGLTAAGERLLVHARAALDAVQAGAAALRPAGAPRAERLRLGLLPSAARSLVADSLVRLRALRPALVLEVRAAANDALLDDLRAGAVDLVVGRMSDPQHMEGLTFELLRIEPLVLAVAQGHAQAGRRPGLGTLRQLPWVVYPEGTVPRHHTAGLFSDRGLAMPDALLETLDTALARSLVLASDAVWATPLGAVEDDLRAGRLARLRVDTGGTEEPIGVLRRRDAPVPAAAAALADLLRRSLAGTRRAARR
ncbi:LysR substrate-binding domain-containing protein [Paracidovorax cattleyae]|uniref:DNA-binding transcriptional regulator, LysR family n=1 Tax=Paracidovorax cattleyae TaxID=80868 RepID=A0A1H0RD95_9BURK|nr:LysR substrate-binding domain-containing protein [Paracidovorax cattleyae]SDP27533.1 DNA-binding transcriptional regulator, LysR family [Paracidovorax cattleyae]